MLHERARRQYRSPRDGEAREQRKRKKALFSCFYTKSRALPNSITIAVSSPKPAKPNLLPPPHPARTRGPFRSENSEFSSLSIQEPQPRLREALGSRRRRRRECAAFAAAGARQEARLSIARRRRRLRSRPHELRNGSSRLRRTRPWLHGRSARRRRWRASCCCCFLPVASCLLVLLVRRERERSALLLGAVLLAAASAPCAAAPMQFLGF